MTTTTTPRLVRDDATGPLHAYGDVTYAVMVGERRVGWVGDWYRWRGDKWGGRRWIACHREAGDTSARWDDDRFRSRTAAVAALIGRIDGDLDDPAVW